MPHLDRGTIHAWIDGAFSSEESARVEQHMDECEECAAIVAEERGIVAGAARIASSLDVVPTRVIPIDTPRKQPSLWTMLRMTPTRAALAATILLAVGTIFTVRNTPPRGRLVDSAPPPSASANVASSSTDEAKAPKATLSPPARAPQKSAAAPSVRRDSVPAPAARSASTATTVTGSFDERKVLDTGRSKPLSDVVATAVPAPAMPNVAAAQVGGTRLEARMNALQSQPAANGPINVSVFTGCYELSPDSLPWPTDLPVRFALVHGTNDSNTVHPLSTDDRVDSTRLGEWHVGAGPVADVAFAPGTSRDSVRLTLTTGGSKATASVNAQSRSVGVKRIVCKF